MKYFIMSDIHGFYDEAIMALNEAGFEKDNPNHTLVVCGDLFDRGKQPVDIYEYIKSLDRVVLIRGNHEYMLEDILATNNVTRLDEYNGCDTTIYRLVQYFGDNVDGPWENTRKAIEEFLNGFVNYFETERYIFTHAWIPTLMDWNGNSYNENWRDCDDWSYAVWSDPYSPKINETNKTGKIIVCGHRPCIKGNASGLTAEPEDVYADWLWKPYIDNVHNFIGIDRCTAKTGEVNVLIIEDEPINKEDTHEV